MFSSILLYTTTIALYFLLYTILHYSLLSLYYPYTILYTLPIPFYTTTAISSDHKCRIYVKKTASWTCIRSSFYYSIQEFSSFLFSFSSLSLFHHFRPPLHYFPFRLFCPSPPHPTAATSLDFILSGHSLDTLSLAHSLLSLSLSLSLISCLVSVYFLSLRSICHIPSASPIPPSVTGRIVTRLWTSYFEYNLHTHTEERQHP